MTKVIYNIIVGEHCILVSTNIILKEFCWIGYDWIEFLCRMLDVG